LLSLPSSHLHSFTSSPPTSRSLPLSYNLLLLLPPYHPINPLSYSHILSYTSLIPLSCCSLPSPFLFPPSLSLLAVSSPPIFSLRKVAWVLCLHFLKVLYLFFFYVCCISIVTFFHSSMTPVAVSYARTIAAAITMEKTSQAFYVVTMKTFYNLNFKNLEIIVSVYYLILANNMSYVSDENTMVRLIDHNTRVSNDGTFNTQQQPSHSSSPSLYPKHTFRSVIISYLTCTIYVIFLQLILSAVCVIFLQLILSTFFTNTTFTVIINVYLTLYYAAFFLYTLRVFDIRTNALLICAVVFFHLYGPQIQHNFWASLLLMRPYLYLSSAASPRDACEATHKETNHNASHSTAHSISVDSVVWGNLPRSTGTGIGTGIGIGIGTGTSRAKLD
jgi:hypothetical protein